MDTYSSFSNVLFTLTLCNLLSCSGSVLVFEIFQGRGEHSIFLEHSTCDNQKTMKFSFQSLILQRHALASPTLVFRLSVPTRTSFTFTSTEAKPSTTVRASYTNVTTTRHSSPSFTPISSTEKRGMKTSCFLSRKRRITFLAF